MAAGLTGLDLGSDLGGSIRMPAGYCGVYGLRPSFGVVPTRGHLPPPPGARAELDMAVLGPLARGADDLALALDVLAGPDEARGGRGGSRSRRRGRHAAGYRIAAWLDDPAYPVDAAVLDVLTAAVDALRRDGVKVDDHPGPVGLAGRGGCSSVSSSRSRQASTARVRGPGRPRGVGRGHAAGPVGAPRHRTRRATGRSPTSGGWTWRRRGPDFPRLRRAAVPGHADDRDPARPHARPGRAPDHRQRRRVPYWDQVRWVQAVSTVHLPVATVPVGLSRAGLPVGVQVVGPFLEDRTVVDVAAAGVGGRRIPAAARF